MLLEGLQLPLTTPFYPDGRLNLLKLEHNTARYSKTPVAGLVALSDCGEPTMLSDEETREALRCIADTAGAEKVLTAGVSCDSVLSTLDRIESAAKFGYDAVLVKRPSLLDMRVSDETAKAVLTYFQAVADRSPLPLLLVSADTGRTGLLQVDLIAELAQHPQIIGLVDTACDSDRLQAIKEKTKRVMHTVTVTSIFAAVTNRMPRSEAATDGLISANTLAGGVAVAAAPPKLAAKTRTKAVGFQVLAGSTARMFEALRAGATGAMPSFAASAPQACYEVLAAWKDGDEGLAQEKQIRLQNAARRVEEQLGVAGIKFGCDLNGYFGGTPRLPLLPLTGGERMEIETLMQGLRN